MLPRNHQLQDLKRAYRGKSVLVTGHTGFKGSWMSQWLLLMGANISGYALQPDGSNALFEGLHLADEVNHKIGDVRDFEELKKCIGKVKPDIIFHLAAQSLVRHSYKAPLETIQVNTLGTVNLLEAIRQLQLPTAVIVITTDKCYENREWLFGYREMDSMGGYDPYSASKGATELLISSYRNSFFPVDKIDQHGIRLASARAGNVIGGGDWAKDRILPDCIRDLSQKKTIGVRNLRATRPWQHVLEPLGGYLKLGEELLKQNSIHISQFCEAFNFAPLISNNRTVKDLVEKVIYYWGEGNWQDHSDPNDFHEASLLNLTIDKAYHQLDWLPQWDFNKTVKETVDWYKNASENDLSIATYTINQIRHYEEYLNISEYEEQESLVL